MPFTPFHMGSGILIKAILQGSFSLMVFGWSQIIMDLQPLWVLLNGHGHMHGFSHTFIGSSLLAVISALSGKYLSEFGLIILKISKDSQPIKISWLVAFISAFIGCFSHVILDGIIHYDVQPFYPFTLNNPMLGNVSFASMHKLCLYAGLFGGALFYLVQWHNRKPKNSK
ncbi:metal-dependent hydrolase [Enterovibrio calviensis]|uniref:metal-dependent hydrolase n=1 Tax=Enterovibrio calviensis TaxID=91359 RepID=UPI000489862B|nr:metal-dependent hydrolase [Enterovibrio calviensis]